MTQVTEARAVLPTDLLALVAHRRDYPNEAWTRERLGVAGPAAPGLGLALDQVRALARRRGVWVSTHFQRLKGLAGARERGGKQAWEIDYLIDATEEHDAVAGLLDCAVGDVGRGGGEKLFLRLGESSPLLPRVLGAGFMLYQQESLYARVGIAAGEATGLRRMEPADSYPAYRLYNSTTPESVRRLEAATFSEWHAAQERRGLRNGAQFVRDRDGRLDAVVRIARLPQGVAIDLVCENPASGDVESLVRSALGAVAGSNLPAFILTPSAGALVTALEGAGFDHQGEYVSLVRRTARPVTLPKLVPAIAKTAVGV